MDFLGSASRDELVLTWLSSEWDQTDPLRQIIDHADLSDPVQNTTGARMLFSNRGPILQEVPYEMRPEWANIRENDLPNLYIIPCREWYLDTGRSFRLADVPGNLKAGRHPVDHLAKVDAIAPSLTNYDAATTTEALILIASGRAGPYMIIDGTHRAAALYRNQLVKPNLPWKGILVSDATIAQSVWYIDSPLAKRSLNLFAWDAELGATPRTLGVLIIPGCYCLCVPCRSLSLFS
jgi:hypothetical protein